MDETEQRVVVYVGPSLEASAVFEQIPNAIVLPPVRQSDLISDLMELEPTHILLIDGEFQQSLAVWQKEIVYALQIPGVKAVYGASSMGALRAADLSDFGMIGSGRIFGWYDEGLIYDESEVALVYYQRPDRSYVSTTVPLVNVRAALAAALEAEALELEEAEIIFRRARAIHWTERTMTALAKASEGFLPWVEEHDQKRIDAYELVCTFASLAPREGAQKPQVEELSPFFRAQFERDRMVRIGPTGIALQHLDAFITLHDVDYGQKIWDANNRALALLLADMYRVTVSQGEFDTEWSRFCARYSLTTVEAHQGWMKENNINLREFCRLMLESARLRKLHRTLGVKALHRRNTQRLLDYLRSCDAYSYWAKEAAAFEERITKSGSLDTLHVDLGANPHAMMMEHLAKSGQSIDGTLETYVDETGFNSLTELTVALARDKLGEENAEPL